MPMTIAHMGVPGSAYVLRPGDKGFILVLGGKLAKPARLSGLRPPFVACLQRNETLMTDDSGCAESSLVAVFNLEILDKEFLADSFHCPVCTEGILSRRDTEITYTFIEDTGFAKELYSEEAESLSFMLRRAQKLIAKQDDPYWPCRSRSFFLESLALIRDLGRPAVSAASPESDAAAEPAEAVSVIPPNKASNDPSNDPTGDRNGMWQAYRISEYLKTHYGERIMLSDVTDSLGINRTTLQKVFKEAYQTSIIGYLRAYRVSMAAFFLRNTALSLKDIAVRVGFSEYSSFFREFTKRTGVNPQAFRDGTGKARSE